MKKNYIQPEFEVTELLAEDILTASVNASGNEVLIDGDDLFS